MVINVEGTELGTEKLSSTSSSDRVAVASSASRELVGETLAFLLV